MSYYISRFFVLVYAYLRRIKFYILSEKKLWYTGRIQPIMLVGRGNIYIHQSVKIGNEKGQDYLNTYAYIESRHPNDEIKIDRETLISNRVNIVASGAKVIIGKKCLIGSNVSIINSDFHDITPINRHKPKLIKSYDIYIGDNVFIGNDVTILKGVTVGSNSVIAAASVVVKNIPPNTIAAGNPAKVIREI